VTIDLKKVRECVCGDIFGELALIYNAKRSATITCLDKGKLWMLDRKTLRYHYNAFERTCMHGVTVDLQSNTTIVCHFRYWDDVTYIYTTDISSTICRKGGLMALKLFLKMCHCLRI
jgi:CRP-like cAMP-binding protein